MTFTYLLHKIRRKGEKMSAELFNELEVRIVSLMQAVGELKVENVRLQEENTRLSEERVDFKSRLDSILKRLEGV